MEHISMIWFGFDYHCLIKNSLFKIINTNDRKYDKLCV